MGDSPALSGTLLVVLELVLLEPQAPSPVASSPAIRASAEASLHLLWLSIVCLLM